MTSILAPGPEVWERAPKEGPFGRSPAGAEELVRWKRAELGQVGGQREAVSEPLMMGDVGHGWRERAAGGGIVRTGER